MRSDAVIRAIDQQDWTGSTADKLQPAVRHLFEAAGPAGGTIKDFLHGKWLGHPLHPVLTDIPVGCWTLAAALDAYEAATGRRDLSRAADVAIGAGMLGAAGAAITGMTDWSETDGSARKVGVMHAALNTVALSLYTASYFSRRANSRALRLALALLGYAIANASAYLGGTLVFGQKIGVDQTARVDLPAKWSRAIELDELEENRPVKVDVGGSEILLVRTEGQVYGMMNVCSHLNGPLNEGELDGLSIRCPWHGSRFSLEDGSVLDGPATHPAPCVEVRTREGWVEVRARS